MYEQAWREAAAENPAFVLSTGDSIQGLDDSRAEAEWRAIAAILARYRRIPFYPAAGNHDIWSTRSEALFRKYTRRAPHYSFDYGQAHFTVLDNSRSQQLEAAELQFLERDLQAHRSQPLKFIVSHRPSWLLDAALRNPASALHQLARKYGVRYIVAGHLHQMLRVEWDGVTYLSMASSGAHLRGSARYEDGWFYQHTLVEVRGAEARFRIKELGPPFGRARVTSPADWGLLGVLTSPFAAAVR